MRLQTLTRKFPTERPPDPESGSPGTVGTVTVAEVQSVLLGTPSSYPKFAAHASPTPPVGPTAPLQIVISPTESRRKWSARLGDPVLCRSASPFVMSARMLLHEGYPPDALVEVWRRNADAWAMRGRLVAPAVKAGLKIIEDGVRRRNQPPPRQGRAR